MCLVVCKLILSICYYFYFNLKFIKTAKHALLMGLALRALRLKRMLNKINHTEAFIV